MSLTGLAIEKNRVTWIAVFLILVAGLQTYGSMPRNEDRKSTRLNSSHL